MSTKKILVGVLIAVGIYLLFKKKGSWFNATYASGDKAGEGVDVASADDYYTNGGGSGYVPGGVDDTSSQASDPDSFYEESTGDSPPIVGDVTSGVSGVPAVGTPWINPQFDADAIAPVQVPRSVTQLTYGKPKPGAQVSGVRSYGQSPVIPSVVR